MDVTVNAVNDAPVCEAVTITTDEDTAGETDPDCTDVDGDTLTYTVTAAANGTSRVAAGKLTYNPDANFNGSDSFTYTANDGAADSNAAGVDVTVNAVNDAPTAASFSVNTNEDTAATVNFAANVSDVETADGDLTYTIVSGPSNGTLTGSSGSQTYTPSANYNGSDTITYKVTDRGDPDNCGAPSASCDGAETSTTETVSITVASVNDAPAGTDNSVTTNEDTAYTFTVADFGFTDPNDTPDDAFQAVKITTLATNGTLKLGAAAVTTGQVILVTDIAAGNLKFHPDADENGTPYATYTFQVPP